MKKALVTSLVSTAILGGGLLFGQTSEATSWTANLPNTIQLVEGQTSYTMVLGDTLWAISQRTNLTVQTLADINSVNLSLGEQYKLPVGRTIYFNGDKVTVKNGAGDVVSETIITDQQKVNPNQNPGEVVDPSIDESTRTPETNTGEETDTSTQPTTPETPVNPEGNNGTDGGEKPVEPGKPVEPEKPVDPEEPEKVYAGDIIPGVENGAVGTWTDKNAMIAYIEANWTTNIENGTWTENYSMTHNGYGWIALFY